MKPTRDKQERNQCEFCSKFAIFRHRSEPPKTVRAEMGAVERRYAEEPPIHLFSCGPHESKARQWIEAKGHEFKLGNREILVDGRSHR